MYRNFLIFSIFIFITNIAYSQKGKITDKYATWEEFEVNAANQKNGAYTLYYNNKIQVKGSYQNDEKQGKWMYQIDPDYLIIGFYKNNQKDNIWNHFLDGKPYLSINYNTGESKCFYPNGSLKSISDSINHQFNYVEFNKEGKLIKQMNSDSAFTYIKDFDENANLIGQLTYKKNFPYEILHNKYYGEDAVYEGELIKGTGKLFIKNKKDKSNDYLLSEIVELKDSKPNGIYEKYSEKGKLMVKGIFNNGFMIGKWKKYDNSGHFDYEIEYSIKDSITEDKKESIFVSGYKYLIHEEMPKFPGKQDPPYEEIMNYLTYSTVYPEKAQENGISGRVYVQFIVNSEGKVSDIKIVRSAHPLLDLEALRVINAMPYWRPGIQWGNPVSVQMSIPVNFKFEDDDALIFNDDAIIFNN